MQKFHDKEPWIANAIIRCLRVWKLRHGPAPMIVTDEDIDQLEAWARSMHELWEMSREHFNVLDIPVRIVPVKIERDGRTLRTW